MKKFPNFYRTLSFVTVFSRYANEPCFDSHEPPPRHTTLRLSLILPSYLRLGLPSGCFLSGLALKISHFPYACHMSHISNLPPLDRPNIIYLTVQIKPRIRPSPTPCVTSRNKVTDTVTAVSLVSLPFRCQKVCMSMLPATLHIWRPSPPSATWEL